MDYFRSTGDARAKTMRNVLDVHRVQCFPQWSQKGNDEYEARQKTGRVGARHLEARNGSSQHACRLQRERGKHRASEPGRCEAMSHGDVTEEVYAIQLDMEHCAPRRLVTQFPVKLEGKTP